MNGTVYRYVFDPDVSMDEIEASLLLAILAAESLHGESQVRLDAQHAVDAERRTMVIDASCDVGSDINRLFVGFVRREFGEDSFRVESLPRSCHHQAQEVAA